MTPTPMKDTAPPAVRKLAEFHQRTPICVPCRRNYRCLLNGILVRLGADAITDADLYQCPACGHQIVRGFARRSCERYGPHKDQFAMNNIRMGDATITDHTGRPIDVADTIPHEDAAETGGARFHCPQCQLVIPLAQAAWDPDALAWRCPQCRDPDAIPHGDAAEAAASQERWP